MVQALTGAASVFVYHLPRITFLGLQILYLKARHGNQQNLTASPVEHLRRARRLLERDNSHLLYAAIEVRFALERLAQRDLLFNEATSNRHLDDSRPVSKIKALRRVEPQSAYPHRVILVNRTTGEQTEFDRYQPLDVDRASVLEGRLGDLLHPSEGLNLGVDSDPWYAEQRQMLDKGIAYLTPIAKSVPFNLFDGFSNMIVVRDERTA